MRKYTLVSFGLSLSTLCLASPSVNNKFALRTDAGNSSTANITACASGVHMIVARASTEAPGEGIIGAVATQVQQSVPGSDSEAVVYPATLTDYQSSESSGVAAMQQLIQDYTARCPSSKIALMGYSQGAQVVGDTLCGTNEQFFNTTAPLSAALSKNIVAVIQMGDPTHVPGLPQDVGNSTKPGIFPRLNTAACATTMANIAQSYCNADDRFCDNGTSIAVHLSYVNVYGTQAAAFVARRVGGSVNSTANSTSSSSGSKTSGVSSSTGSSPATQSKAAGATAGLSFVAVAGGLAALFL